MENKKEIWKGIPGYEGFYQVSNLGNVKSLSRVILKNGKYPFLQKERILSTYILREYRCVTLDSVKRKTYSIHQLVAMAFLGHVPCKHKLVVNHINFCKTDNRVENLEVITSRENSNHRSKILSSKHHGVCFSTNANKWKSTIYINGKNKHLGYFDTELEASDYYQKALSNFKQNIEITVKPKKPSSSKYLGVSWCNIHKKWKARIYKNKKAISVGYHKSEENAFIAIQKRLKNI